METHKLITIPIQKIMFATRQDLLSLKEENLKLKENFKIFLKKHEQNKKYISKEKVKEFMDEQETIINNVNQQIDDIIIVKDENQCKQIAAHIALSRKRKKCEILNIASKKPCMEPKIVKNSLGNFINNPGLQHLAENIFSCLNYKDLESCQLVNRSSVSILANPKFWLNKFVQNGMSKENQNNWIKAIQMTKNTDFERNIQFYLKRSIAKGNLVDIPCYIYENTPKKSSDLIKQFGSLKSILDTYRNDYVYKKTEFQDFTPGCFQVLAPTETMKYSGDWAFLMEFLAKRANLNMIKVISPLLSNPNACLPMFLGTKFESKETPIHYAAWNGHLQIIKFLAPLSDNFTVNVLQSAIDDARMNGQDHVVNYLNSIIESK